MHQAAPATQQGKQGKQSTGNSSDSSARADSSEFVGHVFQKYNESLVRYLSVRLCSLPDAEEVAQEAYARMLKLDEPDTISHLQAYLFKIASNIAIDRLRSQSRQPQHVRLDAITEGDTVSSPDVVRMVEARQQLMLISEIVAELPPKCRKAFMLYKFEGWSYREIAAQMQLTESMIRKYVLRAIVYCHSRLDGD